VLLLHGALIPREHWALARAIIRDISSGNAGSDAAPLPTLALGDDGQGERIAGPAEAFCQVVAQTRHIADVMLQVDGPNARAWMSMAQCFAGPPQDPPAPGSRGIHPA
jgi:hypothetical protein